MQVLNGIKICKISCQILVRCRVHSLYEIIIICLHLLKHEFPFQTSFFRSNFWISGLGHLQGTVLVFFFFSSEMPNYCFVVNIKKMNYLYFFLVEVVDSKDLFFLIYTLNIGLRAIMVIVNTNCNWISKKTHDYSLSGGQMTFSRQTLPELII